MDIETDILAGLLRDEEFSRKAIPHLEPEYFKDAANRVVLTTILTHFEKYKKRPSRQEVCSSIRDLVGSLRDELVAAAGTRAAELDVESSADTQWLSDRAEKFCKDRAVYNAIAAASAIISGDVKGKTADAIPEMLRDALSVSFDERLGHDYFEDAILRWRYYTDDRPRIKFHLRGFNEITGGGLRRKTIIVPVAGTNVGKSFLLCDWATDFVKDGLNVLYISNEMSEEMIGERIDAKMMQVKISDIKNLGEERYLGEVAKAQRTTTGKLKFREYPTRSASVKHFRKLLREFRDKQNLTFDVVMVDYLNNCLPATVRADANSYERNKAIAEELRGLAVEFDCCVIAPTQTNRTGQNHSDVTLEEISESHGVSMTADLMFAMIRTEHLRETNQILIKQLKNRLGSMNWWPKFVIGADFDRMTLHETADQSGAGFGSDRPVFDNTPSGGITLNEGSKLW